LEASHIIDLNELYSIDLDYDSDSEDLPKENLNATHQEDSFID